MSRLGRRSPLAGPSHCCGVDATGLEAVREEECGTGGKNDVFICDIFMKGSD